METPRTFTEHAAGLNRQVASGQLDRDAAIATLTSDILARDMDFTRELVTEHVTGLIPAPAPKPASTAAAG